MQCDSILLLNKQQTGPAKRYRADIETSNSVQKRLEQSGQSLYENAESRSRQRRNSSRGQLPSPALSGTSQEQHPLDPRLRKRKAKSLDWNQPSKRLRPLSEPAHAHSSINQWLARLPQSTDYEPLNDPEIYDDMSQPPSKRARCTDSCVETTTQSGNNSDTALSRDKKYSVYQTADYPIVLETMGSFMRPSEEGMMAKDRKLCRKLFTHGQTIPNDDLFNDDHFSAFCTNFRGRSEARICTDLHPRIMPSVENLCIHGRKEFSGLIEGYNDRWTKSFPFYGPRPQPDHTFGFKWSNFNEQQRRKLNIASTKQSLYTAREDIYFPFLTGEVKCGKQGLDLADLPNAHSMTIALRGIVDLYRRADRCSEVHRRILGFSISHDDRGARLYAHYPVIDGENTTYWRDELREIIFGNNKGKERWQCYRFTLNVCELFALPFLERLKGVINQLPDLATASLRLTTPLEDISVQSSQDNASAMDDKESEELAPKRRLTAQLQNEIRGLQRQLEQQRQDAERTKEREALLLSQLERQHAELEQQRKESAQQRKESAQQHKELMQALKEARQNQ